MVHPDADPQECQLTVHKPAFTEAHEAEDFPAADPITAEHIGQHDNVEDDAVLPQQDNSELISIGCPMMPLICQVMKILQMTLLSNSSRAKKKQKSSMICLSLM